MKSANLRLDPIPKIEPGNGRIVVQNGRSSRGLVFSELSSTYPLKLLSPKIAQDRLAIVYILTYGGGLVGGDSISLSIDVGPGSLLVLLSQGSTKIFKDRSGFRASVSGLLSKAGDPRPASLPTAAGLAASDAPRASDRTTQSMDVRVSSGATLFVLVDPVTCFRNASYDQVQTFRLARDASLFVLDSLTSGRMSLGEEWAFRRYFSLNEVRIVEDHRGMAQTGGGDDSMCVAKDVMLLEQQPPNAHYPLPPRPLADRMAPYSCYAMAILCGPTMQGTLMEIEEAYGKISVFKQRSPPDLIWSFSRIREGKGGIVRVAGVDTESVRNWLKDTFQTLEDIIGFDTYRKAFP